MTTRVTVNITRHETCIYEFEGDINADDAVERIGTGEHDPVFSNIHSEDLDVVHVEQRP